MTARKTMRLAALAAMLALLASGAAPAAEVEVHEAGVGFRARAAVPNLPPPQGGSLQPGGSGGGFPLPDRSEDNPYLGKGAHWLPFEALLEGRGEPVEGTLVLREEPLLDRAPTEYRRHVSLAARGRKRITFPVFSKYEASYALSLEIDGGGHATLGGAREHAIRGPREVGREASLVLFVTARTGAQAHLLHRLRAEEYGDDRVIVPVQWGGLPLDAVAYDAVDVVVLDDVPLGEISERAAAALALHVARGGVLVVSLRENAAGVAGSPLEPLLPGVPDGLESLGLVPSLWTATGELCLFEPPEAVTALALREGAVAWGQSSRAIAHRRHGRGTVVAFGFSLAAPFIVGWSGAPLLMDALCDARCEPLVELPGHARAGISMKGIGLALRDSMVKSMPPFEIVAWSLASYALVVLVFPYMIFRRLDRLEWAWAAILGLALAGAAAVYVIGGRYLDSETYTRRVSIVEWAGPGGTALRHSRWALFSAEGGRVDIAFDSPTTAPSPVPDERDPNASAEALRVSCDAARSCSLATHTQDSSLFETTEVETLGGCVRLGSNLVVERDRDLAIGRAWLVVDALAEEVHLADGGPSRLFGPRFSRDHAVSALRAEADRFFGSVAACILEEAGDAARRRKRPILVFQYEGAPGLQGSNVREHGLSFAIAEADGPQSSTPAVPWNPRTIAVREARTAADRGGTEVLLGAEIPPGFELSDPMQEAPSLARNLLRERSPTFFDESLRDWVAIAKLRNPASVRLTPLGQAYLRARIAPSYEFRHGQAPDRWPHSVSARLTRRTP